MPLPANGNVPGGRLDKYCKLMGLSLCLAFHSYLRQSLLMLSNRRSLTLKKPQGHNDYQQSNNSVHLSALSGRILVQKTEYQKFLEQESPN